MIDDTLSQPVTIEVAMEINRELLEEFPTLTCPFLGMLYCSIVHLFEAHDLTRGDMDRIFDMAVRKRLPIAHNQAMRHE